MFVGEPVVRNLPPQHGRQKVRWIRQGGAPSGALVGARSGCTAAVHFAQLAPAAANAQLITLPVGSAKIDREQLRGVRNVEKWLRAAVR